MIEVDFDFKQRLHEAELSKVIAEKLARVELWVSPITSGDYSTSCLAVTAELITTPL